MFGGKMLYGFEKAADPKWIEENILKLQQAKGDMAEKILNTEKASFGNLTREELLELLR